LVIPVTSPKWTYSITNVPIVKENHNKKIMQHNIRYDNNWVAYIVTDLQRIPNNTRSHKNVIEIAHLGDLVAEH
jgi:hypothetical protein